jgi:hypothetical protein
MPPTRTPVVGESLLLVLDFNNAGEDACEATVELEAAGFEKDPTSPRTYNLPPGKSLQYWSISPKQAGEHSLVVTAAQRSRTVGLNVLSNHFFGTSTMLLISGLLSALGPMATIPWWIERLGRRGVKVDNKKSVLKARGKR